MSETEGLLVDECRRYQREIFRLKQALEKIAEYSVTDKFGYIDEWTEKAAFDDCKNIAREALKEGAQ